MGCRIHAPIALVLAAMCAMACAMLKAGPAPDSGFLDEPQRMTEHRERAPFNRLWVEEGLDLSKYDSLVVASVNTEHVIAKSTWARMNVRYLAFDDDLAGVAAEFRQTVIDAFRGDSTNHLQTIDEPGEKSLILELAITELVPSKAFLATIGLAAWAAPLEVGVPVGAAATFAETGWIAIEGRVRDAATGKAVAMFADREQSKIRVIDVQSLSWYGNAHESMRDWAGQFVQLANTPYEFRVEDSSAFALLPW